jgi:excisionase family DNA binding protein
MPKTIKGRLSASSALSTTAAPAPLSTLPPARLLHPIEDACELLGGVSRTKIYEELKADRLKATKIGSRTFIAHSELERYVAALAA